MISIRWKTRLVTATCILAFASTASAQTPAEFFRGKQVSLYIGFSAGGTYDLYGRVVARHLGKHIPGNPVVVPKNMEGAGSIRVTNYMYAQAPKDGTALATMGRGGAFGPLFGMKGAVFDAQRFIWLGSANDEVSLCASWHLSDVKTFDDLRQRELIIAATGPGDESQTVPKLLNAVLGSKFKVIGGYPGSNEMTISIERNETQGRCAFSWASMKSVHRQWLDEKKLNILVQLSFQKHPEFPHVPLAGDLAKTEEEKQMINLLAARQVMGCRSLPRPTCRPTAPRRCARRSSTCWPIRSFWPRPRSSSSRLRRYRASACRESCVTSTQRRAPWSTRRPSS